MAFLKLVWLCFFGPRLRKNYLEGGAEGNPYRPNGVEKYADKAISFGTLFLSFLYHVSPFFLMYYAIKEAIGIPSFVGMVTGLKQYTLLPVIFSGLFVCRGLGRLTNTEYRQFLTCLIKARNVRGRFSRGEALNSGIHQYDFEMSHYPICFKYSDANIKQRVVSEDRPLTWLEKITRLPIYTFSYFAAHMFGRRLMYPGSMDLLQIALAPLLLEGRTKHVKQRNGLRVKLLAADGNHIDAMFLDRRNAGDHNDCGNTLVICCEGNASFYENGMMEVPMDGDYSVLGWNHPGFGESTGLPFPSQECSAVDVVVKYAVCELAFSYENIVLYGWSIGGYTASWAAMSYPRISAVVLDATFDHILPMAQARMPQSLAGVVETVVTDCLNLNVAECICRYPGPVLLVRRGMDEMITTTSLDIKTNRINFLLVELLKQRYPFLANEETLPSLQAWVDADSSSTRTAIQISLGMNANHCSVILNNYKGTNGSGFPWMVGKDLTSEERIHLLLYAAGQYLVTFDELKHVDRLPTERFRIPLTGNLNFKSSN